MKVTLRSLLPMYLGLASILAAQQTPSIVNSTQAPVKIVSVTSKPFDMAASIALHNSSSEAVVSVRIGLVIAVPAGCGQTTYLSKDHFSDRDVWIAAGQTASLENVGISGAALRKLKREKAASSVMSQITVLEVTFSDGKHWSLERTGSTFDDDMLGAEVQSHCLRSSKQQVADGISLYNWSSLAGSGWI